MLKRIALFFVAICGYAAAGAQYTDDIRRHGREPVAFVSDALNRYDLIAFDDALHSAYEPFVFYNQLITHSSLTGKIHYIFLEAINTTAQPAIDSFLRAKEKDSTILMKAFQDDYAGTGWRFQTYMDLLSTVREQNRSLPDSLKIKVIGVSPPVYWEAIHTWKDYELFQNSLQARDYFMYLEILRNMKKGRKGMFFTNTRHAYKNIRNAAGKLYWNTATFFTQWNPGMIYSIRIHNVTLSIESARKPATQRKSTDGLGEKSYKWIKMDGGRWDAAFAENGNRPVAVPFKRTSFGQTPYVGNHMLNVAPGTTMYDAYDALIFLAPLTELHFSAQFNYIYTPQFKPELERRLWLLKGDGFLKREETFDEYFRRSFGYVPVEKNTFLKE